MPDCVLCGDPVEDEKDYLCEECANALMTSHSTNSLDQQLLQQWDEDLITQREDALEGHD